MASTTYTARDITVLEGLEPVRKRPGMYIGGVDTRGLHHLVNEIVDNAIDEVINGYATRLEVTLFEGGREIEVVDNGRGIPVDIHPKYKKSALELILTTLHAGGKFDQGNYVHAGGLHGVGASVVCALSSEMTVTVRRDGHEWKQTYAQGKATSKVQKVSGGEKVRGSGTTIRFRPDVEIFGKLAFDAQEIRERLEAKTYLHRGLRVVFLDETEKPARRDEFTHEGGLADWLTRVVLQRGKGTTGGAFNLAREGEPRLELALVWTESTEEHVRSYVNGISTPSGGTHENGLRSGVTKAVRNYVETHELLPKGVTVSAEDIREGLVVLLSAYVLEPQFQGQTKDRLNNPEIAAQVDGAVRPALEKWLNENPTLAEQIVGRIVLASRAREGEPRGGPGGHAQDGGLAPAEPSGKARGLFVHRSRPVRALHRRGRLGGRLGEAGPRPPHAGDPPAARQGAERGAGERREGHGQPRALGHRLGARLRRRRGLRHRQSSATGRSFS